MHDFALVKGWRGNFVHIYDRLKIERQRLGLSQDEFARQAGVSKRAQANYESGERHPKADYLETIHSFGVDTNFIVTGERIERQKSDVIAEQESIYLDKRLNDPDVASIPMYDVECAAGSGRSFEGEPVLGYFHMDRTVLSELKLPADSGAWVRARGDSMVGTIDDGDYVFVDFTQRDPSREGVYLILMDGERRIKRMQRVAGGGWLLISDNPRYDKELIAPEQKQFVEILGRCLVNLGQVL
ncbi:XRE family transcriptional regulator [Vreelandella piezotolerans]|uniref:XRE family transcriptional regulator n=1 Tax=Vreelandella piezotolerans TaxID=2609667 RepID=UPI0037B2C7D8